MIGAKMANPDKFCLNLMGDGAFGMSGTDIETAARSGFAITTVILNNGGMATYPEVFQQQENNIRSLTCRATTR